MTRSIIWLIAGIALLALITQLVAGNWITTSLVTVIHHGVFVLVYYLHERFWLRFNWLRTSKWKPFVRVITYEVILGNLILGIITLIFTGSLQQMTQITLIYISNKYWMFYAYDYIWSKINWKSTKVTRRE